MIARILSLATGLGSGFWLRVGLALAVVAVVGGAVWWQVATVRGLRADLATVTAERDAARADATRTAGKLAASEAARAAEIEAANRDVIALLKQHDAAIEAARRSARTITEITDARCLDTSTGGRPRGLVPADRLRDAAGARPAGGPPARVPAQPERPARP